MNLYQEFLIIAGIICGLAGCASTSDEMATSTKAASVQSSEVNNAKSISKRFLIDKKAVCINLIKDVNSFYLDNGSINVADEIIMIIKTKLNKSEIERYISKIHNYKIPLIVEIKSGLPNLDYADWFAKNAE